MMEFSTAVKEFLEFCAFERRLSDHSISAYDFDLRDFERWLSPEARREQLHEDQLKLYLEHLVTERKLSVSTVRRRLACLRSFFRRQQELGRQNNPFQNWVPKVPRRKRLPRSLARSEVLSLFNAEPEKQNDRDFHTAISLMIATGLRVGELCTLRLEDASPDCSVIRIHGKGARDRIAYIADIVLRAELAALIARRHLRAGQNAQLLVNRLGRPMRTQSIRSKLRRIAVRSGLQRRITPHMLRHTAATLLIETGVDIRFVQRLLGHSSIATTEIYTHVTDEALRRTLERADVLASLKAA
jgi:site-specific recombinase XerD